MTWMILDMPRCRRCGDLITGYTTARRAYCSVRCRVADHRERKRSAALLAGLSIVTPGPGGNATPGNHP